MKNVVVRQIDRPPKEIVEGFKQTSTPSVHASIGDEPANVMDPEIKPIAQGLQLAGPAITVLCAVGDNLMMHKALTLVKSGDVLVINAHGYTKSVMWGGITTIAAMAIGLAGVVLDGSCRDVAEIRKMGFPVFTRAISPHGSDKAVAGSVNIPIQCGGVTVRPGDVILGDDDGVVVVRKDSAAEVLERAKKRDAKEKERKKSAGQGVLSYNLNPKWQRIVDENVEEIEGPVKY